MSAGRMLPATGKPAYGLDAPGVVRGLFMGGLLAIFAGLLLLHWPHAGVSPVLQSLGRTAFITGLICFAESLLMAGSSFYGKFRARDRLVNGLALRGDEIVLDVGCGHGLLLIGAATRLGRGGRAVGLDLWSQVDQASNTREATLRNAALEGVAERVEVHDGDMRNLPFPDAAFDAVVASLSIHNISSRAGRREAIQEIARVLRPGGHVALMDFKHVGQYAKDLREAGLPDTRVSGYSFWIFPPVRTVTARKPRPGAA